MRKTLILIAIIVLLVLTGFMLFNSLNIGGLQILGLQQISQKNKELESSIQTLSRLSSTGIEEATKDVSNSVKQYNTTKAEYDEYVQMSRSNQLGANQIQKYEIEYLWTKLGQHASNDDVILKFEVEANATSDVTGCFDLKFTVSGDYVSTTDFIYDIENDSALGFKIEKFNMKPIGEVTKETKTNVINEDTNTTTQEAQKQTTMNLQTTFTCTNIAINIDPSLLTKKENNENEESKDNAEQNTDNQNTTNTTNTTSSTNTNTNVTNTTNTTN